MRFCTSASKVQNTKSPTQKGEVLGVGQSKEFIVGTTEIEAKPTRKR
jgi:hypothetical protein